MTQSLAKYHARAPRYILDTDDDYLIRLAGPRQVPWEEGTEIKNVSLTGLAFTAPQELCPILGEVIKIQFTIPAGTKMACHGVVTRLEGFTEKRMLVGVHFYKIEMAHRLALAQGISRKFTSSSSNASHLEIDPSHIFTYLPHIFMMGTSLYCFLILFYSLLAWGPEGWLDGLLHLLKILA